MRVSIIAVGTELLFGQTVNTNAAYLSEQLNLMGFDVMYHFVVGDNPKRLKEKLIDAFQDTNIALLTGGLGPTQDDITKEVVAEYMGTDMYLNEDVRYDLVDFFNKRGKEMTENNLKQAYLPVGSTPFYNATGTAPGFALEKNGKIAICFPGPPVEMRWLFENGARQYLEDYVDKKMYYRVIRTIGIGESDLETLLLPVIDGQTDPTIATYAKEGECALRVASQRHSINEAKAAVLETLKEIDDIIGKYIYSYDDKDLNDVVVNLLKEKNLKLSAAESCTGGMFASSVTDIPGASEVFILSYVTYTANSKIKNLGVRASNIEKNGVVSPEVAIDMALCAREKSGSDISISITGYAGPEADTGYSAGEAYIGYVYGGIQGYLKVNTSRNLREWNRKYFVLMMLKTIYLLITDKME
ncbi:MAG TPA: competence/damage-inducible protein A [Mogibacterium sp.]|nr:competence/damage-inducible protein A [Mogibacterium sp.]